VLRKGGDVLMATVMRNIRAMMTTWTKVVKRLENTQ